MNKVAPIPKFIMLGVLALLFASPFIPFLAGLSTYLVGFGFLTLAVHGAEYFFYKDRLTAKAPGGNHFLPVPIFGVLYIKPVLRD